MENRKLVEDRAAVDEPQVSGDNASGANSTGNEGPAANSTADTAESDTAETAETTEPAAGSDPKPDTGTAGDSTPAGGSAPPDPPPTVSYSGSSPTPATPPPPSATSTLPPVATPTDTDEERPDGLFGTKVPTGVAIIMALVLPAVGFFIGMIGSGKDSSSNTVNAIISPENAGGPLTPGKTARFTVLVQNPNDYGAQVTAIEAGRSQATPSGCAEGTVTSEEVSAPRGYIRPNGVRAYSVNATMAPNAGPACENQTFTLPLTVDLESAAG